jgi:hypothetical protein
MHEQQEQRTEDQVRIRQVTHYQISWTERERGEPGAFTIQLILDHGAAEYILRPTADDASVLGTLLARTTGTVFDLDRKVLIFGNRASD